MYLSIYVFLGLSGGGSGDSMVPLLRPGLLKLSSGSWDKRGWFPPLAWRKLSGTMGSHPGVGCGIDVLWSLGHRPLGQPESWDWRMSGYGFPILLKSPCLRPPLLQFFSPGTNLIPVQFISTDETNIHYIDVSKEVFMEYAKRIHPKYQGDTINWVEVDKSKIYFCPKFTDMTRSKEYAQRFGFQNDPDFDYVKGHVDQMGRKPVPVTNLLYHNKDFDLHQ